MDRFNIILSNHRYKKHSVHYNNKLVMFFAVFNRTLTEQPLFISFGNRKFSDPLNDHK